MENMLGTALKISGIGIVVLLLVLVVLAGIVYLMTRFIVDKEDKEEMLEEEKIQPNAEVVEPRSDLKLAAAVAVAIARAQADTQAVTTETSAGEVNSWRQFGLQRRLNQSSTIRRAR
jgi:sodium pump decarboxylase gamma subunit